MSRFVILQTSVPDYRIALFDLIEQELSAGVGFRVYAGDDYFAKSVVTRANSQPWFWRIPNRFLVGRRLLWQSFDWLELLDAHTVVIELNPRILSNWALLGIRSVVRRPIVVWGHAWPRSGPDSVTTLLRLLMMFACTGVVVYTATQRIQLKRWWGVESLPARNSVFSRQTSPYVESGPREGFIYVGRLVPEKGVLFLVKAYFAYVAAGGRGALQLVGDGPEKEAIVRFVEKNGLQEVIILHGHISDTQELARIYRRARYSVSPGYVGLSAIQSFYMGVPMIVSRFENHAPEIEACEEGKNALFFDEKKEEVLAALLFGVHQGEVSVQWSGLEISAHARQHYSLESMAEALLTEVRYSRLETKDHDSVI